jgi:hypothetical protein
MCGQEKKVRTPHFRTWSPLSYQAAASNHSIVFVTGYTGRSRAEAVIGIAPNHTGPSHAFAFTTRETEAATGFGTRAAAAHWEVIYMSEDVFPELDPGARLNFIVKQVCSAILMFVARVPCPSTYG